LIILTGVFGFFGLIMGLIFISIHVISTSSFGVPYLTPLAPFNLKSIKLFFLGRAEYTKLGLANEKPQSKHKS
jgi:hypothetical protein